MTRSLVRSITNTRSAGKPRFSVSPIVDTKEGTAGRFCVQHMVGAEILHKPQHHRHCPWSSFIHEPEDPIEPDDDEPEVQDDSDIEDPE
jgi:hypothetical protein